MTTAEKITEAIRIKGEVKNAITQKTGEDAGDVFSEYPEKILAIQTDSGINCGSGNSHVDANGVWHKPDDWDDIESMTIEEGKSELYFLYANHIGNGNSFCRLRPYGSGTIQWAIGNVANGVFVPKGLYTTISSGGYITIDLEQYEDDYSVIHVKSSNTITSCLTQPWNGTNKAFSAYYNTCLMRYGRMPKGTNIVFQCYYLESDNVMDFAKELSGTAITLTNAYNMNMNMARWRNTGWNVKNNTTTSLSGTFYFCCSLVDIDNMDVSGWCSVKTTSLANMFYYCLSLNKDIDVSDWVVTNVTSMSNLFCYCLYIQHIKGLETWGEAQKCTNTSSMFNATRSLCQKIDLSALKCGSFAATYTSCSSMFNACGATEIDLSGWYFYNITTAFTYFFYAAQNLRKVTLTGCTMPVACTSFCQLFYMCNKLEEVELDGWDFTHIATNATTQLQYMFYNCFSLKKISTKNCTPISGIVYKDTSTSYGQIFYNCYNLEYLDATWIDMSIFSSTYAHLYSFRYLYKLVDFYPPTNISKSFYISHSQMLSHDSLVRIIDNLVESTATTKPVLTIGTINKSKLSDKELQLVTDKGWTIA